MTLLWGEDQAPIWLPKGRVMKYLSDSVAGIFVAVPVTATCRWIGIHGNSRETFAFPAICWDLRLLKFVKKTKPRLSNPLSNTARCQGCPFLSTVDSDIALGSTNSKS